jgi:hypothetical protein
MRNQSLLMNIRLANSHHSIFNARKCTQGYKLRSKKTIEQKSNCANCDGSITLHEWVNFTGNKLSTLRRIKHLSCTIISTLSTQKFNGKSNSREFGRKVKVKRQQTKNPAGRESFIHNTVIRSYIVDLPYTSWRTVASLHISHRHSQSFPGSLTHLCLPRAVAALCL